MCVHVRVCLSICESVCHVEEQTQVMIEARQVFYCRTLLPAQVILIFGCFVFILIKTKNSYFLSVLLEVIEFWFCASLLVL